jgi:hypothetical protein
MELRTTRASLKDPVMTKGIKLAVAAAIPIADWAPRSPNMHSSLNKETNSNPTVIL